MPRAFEGEHTDFMYPSAVPFVAAHLACFAAIWTGVTWQALVLCAALYVLRMFGVVAGYHRYFSHRTFSTSRRFRSILVVLAPPSRQRTFLWCAAKYQHHHP